MEDLIAKKSLVSEAHNYISNKSIPNVMAQVNRTTVSDIVLIVLSGYSVPFEITKKSLSELAGLSQPKVKDVVSELKRSRAVDYVYRLFHNSYLFTRVDGSSIRRKAYAEN